MTRNELDVLLVGGSRQGWWRLAQHLEHLECHCWFALTADDVRDLLAQRRFRLILSARPVTEGSNLMELLRAPERTVFYSFPVENGCLWFRAMPEIIRGERCPRFVRVSSSACWIRLSPVCAIIIVRFRHMMLNAEAWPRSRASLGRFSPHLGREDAV